MSINQLLLYAVAFLIGGIPSGYTLITIRVEIKGFLCL